MAKKVITAYYRVSTKAETQKSSFKNQPKFFVTIFEMLKGRDKVDGSKLVWHSTNYYDWGISGTKLSREGFNQMLLDAGLRIEKIEGATVEHPYNKGVMIPQTKYVTLVDKTKKPQFNQIWIKSVSRFARNINGWDILHSLYLAGVDVWFYDADLHSAKKEDWNAIRKQLDDAMAYSEQLSRGREIVQIQRERENIVSAKAPRGFIYHKRVDDSPAYYTIEDYDADIVRDIFRLSREGYGQKKIEKLYAEQGRKWKDGKKISYSSIGKVILNEKYKGYNTVSKYNSGKVFEKAATAYVRKDFEAVPCDLIPAIVTEEEWNEANAGRISRHIEINENTVVGVRPFSTPYQDYLRCGYCGEKFRFELNTGGNPHFRCSTKRRKSAAVCNCTNVYLYQLEKWVADMKSFELANIIRSDYENTITQLIYLIEFYLDKLYHPEKITNEELIALEEQLELKGKQFNDVVEELYSDLAESSRLILEKKKKELNDEMKDLEAQIQSFNSSSDKYIARLEELFGIVFEEIRIAENIQDEYTEDEVFELLDKIEVFGKTEPNQSNRPPKITLIPHLKEITKAYGLIKADFKPIKYSVLNYVEIKENEDRMDELVYHRIPKDERATFSETLIYPSEFPKNIGFEDDNIILEAKEFITDLFEDFLNFRDAGVIPIKEIENL